MQTVDKVASTDIPQLRKFSLPTIASAKRILTLLAKNTGISMAKLTDRSHVSHDVVADFLHALTLSGLVVRVPLQGAATSTATKPSKYMFTSPTIRAAFLDAVGSEMRELIRQGMLLADAVASNIHQNPNMPSDTTLRHAPGEGGADFILNTHTQRAVIEVGRGDKTMRQVQVSMAKYKASFGPVFSDTELKLAAGATVIFVPWEYFALT